jgi:superfamily II DNA or RNA helicase
MVTQTTPDIIATAINKAVEMNPQETDGEWLEVVTVESGPYIKEWDIEECWSWDQWPDRETRYPNTTRLDVGIDAVAVRRGGSEYIAIQCKSRRLDENGRGSSINNNEITKFTSASSSDDWAERWVVTNGDNPLASGAQQSISMQGKPVKLVNITNDLQQQWQAYSASEEGEQSANPDGEEQVQTKSGMQNEAVANSVRILKEQERSESAGLPLGEARGRIILPCGTGKTRISLRIVEELTPSGEMSVVLCPSIALVSQIRREYLQHAAVPIDVLAVCSDVSAGYDPKKEGNRNATVDPTVDNGNVSASEVKGRVTTDAGEIADWMKQSTSGNSIKVVIGTYQSSARVSEALLIAGVKARVLIADEAHRTAGLKRKNSKSAAANEEEKRLRDFTVCHDSDRFPVTYRVYQTATPRIYDGKPATGNPNWIVRSMDDAATFGVELYRKSYLEAVNNGWLSDYRIIALGINDPEAFETANDLAKNTKSKGRGKLTTTDYMSGLAFALTMGGGTQGGEVDIRSCIAFMNTVDKSKNMASDLQTDSVKQWVSRWLSENADGRALADYSLEHLDASSNAAARETAKGRLAAANSENPHGIINVGIFGEGTDSPSLSAVAFLEPRKSPIDVVQAVGRAMRTSPGKKLGYIICPIHIPPSGDPENWLKTSAPEEGWQELGQILRALRAHDSRIEDNLEELLNLYIPKPPPVERTLVAVAKNEGKRIQYGEVIGPPGAAQEAVEQVLSGKSRAEAGIRRISEQLDVQATDTQPPDAQHPAILQPNGERRITESAADYETPEMTQVLTGKLNEDGSKELRADSVARENPKAGEPRGVVNIQKTKAKAKAMINDGKGGVRVPPREKRKPRKTARERAEEAGQMMLKLSGLEDHGSAIKMNLLSKSGLTENRVMRDLNILEASVSEAARHLRADNLLPALNRHFVMDRLKKNDKKAADGCTVAALMMMNAAMLHQRISNGGWLSGISDLSLIKNEVNVVQKLSREWERIMRHDFHPVLEPALEAIYAIEETGKTAGLERALHHIAAEAERIAETYADMGADHAGPLFNRVMGNQASDGAFFTRPVAASIAARLTLDACGDFDWSNPNVWRNHKTVDLACGSGTLLAAMLADMKRRAAQRGADEDMLTQLQKIAVEDVIKGLDINPVSLQLAASQLTAGNHRVSYRRMGLHQMPYGPDKDNPGKVSAGTLELLGQSAIVTRRSELNLDDDAIGSQATWASTDAAYLEDAVDAAKDARIVIMNPPFTNRAKMGEKFSKEAQESMRKRTDNLEAWTIANNPKFKNFVMLADFCLHNDIGTLTMINPTIALSAPSGLNERRTLAERYQIHTVLTGRWAREFTLSQNTEIDESIIVATRSEGNKVHTRFVQLDKMPVDESEVDDLHRCLLECEQGQIANGWGEISYWPAELIAAGDWTSAIWRSPDLAEGAAYFANHPDLKTMQDELGLPGAFPILKSKSGIHGQKTIRSRPDDHWIPKKRDDERYRLNGGIYPEVKQILQKAGHLLITTGHDSKTGRLTATADNECYVGNGWMPVPGLPPTEAKAAAVFINSTAGRLQLMRHAGRKIPFPAYSAAEAANLRIPDIKDDRIRRILSTCWERTKDIEVPQFRDGECEVRRLWDEAVAEAMGWDAAELERLRLLLHQEPHVRGLRYGQYADEVENAHGGWTAEEEHFLQLLSEWRKETAFQSSPRAITGHSSYQQIIDIGKPALPFIFEDMQENGGWWYPALRAITGDNPVPREARGSRTLNDEAWLRWGQDRGYA